MNIKNSILVSVIIILISYLYTFIKISLINFEINLLLKFVVLFPIIQEGFKFLILKFSTSTTAWMIVSSVFIMEVFDNWSFFGISSLKVFAVHMVLFYGHIYFRKKPYIGLILMVAANSIISHYQFKLIQFLTITISFS